MPNSENICICQEYELLKMKILMIHPHDIYSASEPWTIRMTSIAHEFVKKGHDVKLVYFPLSEKHRGLIKNRRINEFETIPFNRSDLHILKNIDKMIALGKWADIVHFQKCFAHASIPALFCAYANSKPVHYDWDDWEYGIYMWKPPSKLYSIYLNLFETSLPKLVDSISVSSDELSKMAVNLGFEKDKIVKANVCADLNRFRPRNNKNKLKKKYGIKGDMILYLGQLHGAQHAEILLRAIKLANKTSPEANYVFVGGGADMPRLKNIASLMRINNVVFTGFLEDNKVNDYLDMADVAIACFADNRQVRCKSPLKIAEYLASGKAIVASSVGEIPWMIGDAGILTRPGDEEDLAKGILKIIKNKKLRRELENKARKRAQEAFNWSDVADNILRCYQKIVF